jgi:hypothetical protein
VTVLREPYNIKVDTLLGTSYPQMKYTHGDTGEKVIFEIVKNGEVVDLSNKTTTVTIRKNSG